MQARTALTVSVAIILECCRAVGAANAAKHVHHLHLGIVISTSQTFHEGPKLISSHRNPHIFRTCDTSTPAAPLEAEGREAPDRMPPIVEVPADAATPDATYRKIKPIQNDMSKRQIQI